MSHTKQCIIDTDLSPDVISVCGVLLPRIQGTAAKVRKHVTEGLRERNEHLDIFIFPPITRWCFISDALFTGGRGVSDFSVLKYY